MCKTDARPWYSLISQAKGQGIQPITMEPGDEFYCMHMFYSLES